MSDDIQALIAIVSLLSAIVGLIAAIVGRKQVIEIRDTPNTQTPQTTTNTAQHFDKLHWYDKTIWLVVAFILFWPVGLYGIYKSRAVSSGWKKGVFITFGVLILLSLIAEQ